MFSEEDGQDRPEVALGEDVTKDDEVRDPGLSSSPPPCPESPGTNVAPSEPQTKLRPIIIDGSNVCCLEKVFRSYPSII